jgi:hypothetical protein
VAEIVFPRSSREFRNLKWIKEKLDILSEHRNDAAHVAISFYSPPGFDKVEVLPDFSTRPQSVSRLTEKPIKDIWRTVRGDLHAVAEYASSTYIAIHWPEMNYTLPRRPRLLAVPTKRRRVRKKSRFPATTTHQPPSGSQPQ